MASKYLDIAEQVREEVDDLQEDSLSGYSLRKKVNRVLGLIGNRLIELKAPLVSRQVGLLPVNGECELPEDFQNLVLVTDEYTTPEIAAPVLAAQSNEKTASLSWNAVDSADKYFVYKSKTSGTNYELVAETVNNTVTVTGLSNRTTYYFVVVAYGNGMHSQYSNEAAVSINYTVTDWRLPDYNDSAWQFASVLRVSSYPDLGNVNCIWKPLEEIGVLYFRKKFTLAATASITLYISCDDLFTLYIDGQLIGSGGIYQNVYSSILLEAGEHVIAVRCENTIQPAASLSFAAKKESDNTCLLSTDTTWKYALTV